MRRLLTYLLLAKTRQLRDAFAELLYYTVSRTYFPKRLRENRLNILRLLF
jgi:hypothetical protein